MQKHAQRALLLISAVALTMTACKKDDDDDNNSPTPVNEEEVITSVIMTFTPTGGGDVQELSFRDVDGDGGNPPVIIGDTLSAGTIYTATLQILNESETPTDTTTYEIMDESDVHQFFFAVSGADMTWSYADQDVNGYPIGLQSNWTVGNASSGSITVTLRHEPDKTAPGVSDGDITNAGGETDVEVTLPVVIQ